MLHSLRNLWHWGFVLSRHTLISSSIKGSLSTCCAPAAFLGPRPELWAKAGKSPASRSSRSVVRRKQADWSADTSEPSGATGKASQGKSSSLTAGTGRRGRPLGAHVGIRPKRWKADCRLREDHPARGKQSLRPWGGSAWQDWEIQDRSGRAAVSKRQVCSEIWKVSLFN